MVILAIALLVMGPKRIPELASSLGKAIRSFRKATRELRDQIDIDEEVRRPLEDLRSALRDDPHHQPPPLHAANPPRPAPVPAQPSPAPVAHAPVATETGEAQTTEAHKGETPAK